MDAFLAPTYPFIQGRSRKNSLYHRHKLMLLQYSPFGLKNLRATWKLLVKTIFTTLIRKTMMVYVDAMINKKLCDRVREGLQGT